jgi:NAD(P)H-nitrite reductase large subunit
MNDVFAIGECALWEGKIFGLVAPGYQMARVVAAATLCAGEARAFTGADMSTKLKLLGVDVASFGDAHGRTRRGRKATSGRMARSKSIKKSWSARTVNPCSVRRAGGGRQPNTRRWCR